MPTFIPFEFPKSNDGEFDIFLSDEQIFRNRRTRLGLSQQEVADMAGVTLRQYQRLEAGDITIEKSNADFALSVCAVLLLDPYKMTGIDIKQPDPATLQPQIAVDTGDIKDLFTLKRPGRKPVLRDQMKVYLNYQFYSLIVPYEVLQLIDNPQFIVLRWNFEDNRILISPAMASDEEAFDVPEQKYESQLLAFPEINIINPISEMNWGDIPQSVIVHAVKANNGTIHILIDLKKATANDTEGVNGFFMIPERLTIDKDEDIDDE